jgi:dienelactone hydrolase
MPHAQPDGFLAIPPTGKGSAVLVLHAWWGLNDTMRAFCTRLAESGFVAFAPDLYRTGRGPATTAARKQPTSVTLRRRMSLSRNPTSTSWRQTCGVLAGRWPSTVTVAPDTGSLNLTARKHSTKPRRAWRGIEP